MNGTQAYVLSRKQLSLLGTAAYLDAGVANGVATLDDAGKVPSMQLPSYVDDVLEYNTMADFPPVGESGKIYVDKSTNKSYRWSGSTYIFSGSDLALGETSTTAYRGDRGKAAYDHSLVTSGNPHNITKGDLGLGNVENKSSATIRSELTKSNVTTALGYTPPTTNTTYTIASGDINGQIKVTPSSGNAYNVNVKGLGSLAYKDSLTKTDVGLGNVENKSSATIRSELTKSNVTTALGYTPPTTDTNTTYTLATGDNNGQIKVTPSSGNAYNVNVKGLGSLAYKSSLAKADVTNALGYTPPTTDTNTTYTIASGDSNGQIKVTPSSGNAYNVNVKGLGSLAYKSSLTYSDVGAAASSHTHSYLPLSGGTETGNVLMANNTSIIFSKSTDATNRPYITYGESDGAINHLDLNGNIVYIGSNVLLIKPGSYTSSQYSYRITTNSSTLTLNGGSYTNIGANTAVQCRNLQDSAWVDINCKNLHENSSRRYKTNIKDLSEEEALKVLQLRPVTFTYKHGEDGQRGLIAEEVEPLIPGAVSYTELNGTKVPDGLSYTTFIPYLVKMIQMQQEEINKLKAKLK